MFYFYFAIFLIFNLIIYENGSSLLINQMLQCCKAEILFGVKPWFHTQRCFYVFASQKTDLYRLVMSKLKKIFSTWGFFGFFSCRDYIQHCFICRPLDATVLEDAVIEPRTVVPSVRYISSTLGYTSSTLTEFV
jgi:hypothetical protein